MSEMIERCVEAAFEADWRFGAQFHPEDQRKIVAAIVAAMQQPTIEMGGAGYAKGWQDGPVEVYKAMLDEALK